MCLVTAPGTYNDDHAVFFNGTGGATRFDDVEHLGIQGVLGANASTIKLSNPNVVPLDLDGDGKINLLHMPAVKTYAIYTPEIVGGKWKWVGREVSTVSGLESEDRLRERHTREARRRREFRRAGRSRREHGHRVSYVLFAGSLREW